MEASTRSCMCTYTLKARSLKNNHNTSIAFPVCPRWFKDFPSWTRGAWRKKLPGQVKRSDAGALSRYWLQVPVGLHVIYVFFVIFQGHMSNGRQQNWTNRRGNVWLPSPLATLWDFPVALNITFLCGRLLLALWLYILSPYVLRLCNFF